MHRGVEQLIYKIKLGQNIISTYLWYRLLYLRENWMFLHMKVIIYY